MLGRVSLNHSARVECIVLVLKMTMPLSAPLFFGPALLFSSHPNNIECGGSTRRLLLQGGLHIVCRPLAVAERQKVIGLRQNNVFEMYRNMACRDMRIVLKIRLCSNTFTVNNGQERTALYV